MFLVGYVRQVPACGDGSSLIPTKPDDRIEVEIKFDELDLTSTETTMTYKEIQEYVLEKHGLNVSNLYISQADNLLN